MLIAAATHSAGGLVAGAVLGWLAGMSPQVAKQWERAVVLRLGHYRGLRGPGLFWRSRRSLRSAKGVAQEKPAQITDGGEESTEGARP